MSNLINETKHGKYLGKLSTAVDTECNHTIDTEDNHYIDTSLDSSNFFCTHRNRVNAYLSKNDDDRHAF